MNPTMTIVRGISGAALGLAILCSGVTVRPESSPVQAGLHVMKITSGPAGSEVNGTFVLSEERSTFSRINDKEVIVYFMWDGTAGPHKLVANWRSPDGSLSSSSAIEYVAKDRRFGAYWRLTLGPTLPTGTWSIEATVDGQPGGRYTFEVTDATPPSGTPTKKPLPQSELYETLNRAFVLLQRTTTEGRQLETTAGLAMGNRVYTIIGTIDETDQVHAAGADGKPVPLPSVLAWSRREHWAVLPVDQAVAPSLPLASVENTAIGDRCFSMEGGTGARVLLEGTITGRATSAGPVPRFIVTFYTGLGTPGAPVMNQFGEVIGIIGGGTAPGPLGLRRLMRTQAELRGAGVIPLSAFRLNPDAAPTTLAELRTRGDVIAPAKGLEHVLSGGFATGIIKKNSVQPADQRDEFSLSEKGFTVFVTWSPLERLRGMMSLRVYDADNRVIMEGKPAKRDLRKGTLVMSSWQLPMPGAAGLYRADVFLDQTVMWRSYVRVTP
jgi:hypothetical protein